MTDPADRQPMTVAELQERLAGSPFATFLGLRVLAADAAAQAVTVAMPMRAELERLEGSGQLHGGAIASLIDIAGDFALILTLRAAVPTIDYRVDYLRPAMGGEVVATARVRRAGRTIGVVDIDVADSAGRLVAVGRGCYGTRPG